MTEIAKHVLEKSLSDVNKQIVDYETEIEGHKEIIDDFSKALGELVEHRMTLEDAIERENTALAKS